MSSGLPTATDRFKAVLFAQFLRPLHFNEIQTWISHTNKWLKSQACGDFGPHHEVTMRSLNSAGLELQEGTQEFELLL